MQKSNDQKKHRAHRELIKQAKTFLLNIFVSFIILHQVTGEELTKPCSHPCDISAGRAQGRNET